MKKTEISIYVVLSSMLLYSCGRSSDPFRGMEPEKPTIFYLGITSNLPDIEAIVFAAAEESFENAEEDWRFFENVIILEEDKYWTVSFHARGNGNFKNSFSSFLLGELQIFDGAHVIVYLDKETLMAISPPSDAFRFAPLVTPELFELYREHAGIKSTASRRDEVNSRDQPSHR